MTSPTVQTTVACMALQTVAMLWNDYRGILHELEIAANMHETPVLETTAANRGTHSRNRKIGEFDIKPSK